MIRIEQGKASPCAQPALRAMFRARKQVFVDLLRWDVPVVDGQYELDEFDDEHATYVLVTGEDGRHLASARLLPTTRPHILGSLFPQLCAGEVPVGADIFEITRFCLDCNQPARGRRDARNLLVSALVGFALEHGIRTYTGVAEVGWLQQILAFGWDCRPLGPPLQLDCGMLGALAIHVSANSPLLLARNGIWSGGEIDAADLAQAA
jgi:N-acyl-L-homoserine lactone synthetase